MNVDCINAFISAGTLVLKQATQQDVSTGKAFVKTTSAIEDAVCLIVGLTGKIRGKVSINMDKKMALDLASSMMGGYTVTEFDEMTSSAVGELANMIAGNASTILYDKGIGIEITPPSVIQGQNTIIVLDGITQVICIPLSLAGKGTIELDICIRE